MAATLLFKVLRHDLRDNADRVRRFVEEAQIGGQLQHPGVVPIYELGTFADNRPFFSMKLVKGQTLAELLSSRPSPTAELPRFLSIFAAMAQTMAYSHTRGVIHRDLKPSNVMVGSFVEVQVMDWGLAKVLARGGVVDDAQAGKEKPPETIIATARSGSDSDLSRAGSVMGTSSYMPHEQAVGDSNMINERADVFALGSILCEILTGSPCFTGPNTRQILRKAERGETADALARLSSSGAEAELLALAKDCLEVEPDDRPRDANIVAERITAYLSGVQERVQAAEREKAVAIARAIEERRRRKVQLALAASILAFITLGGLSTTFYLQQRAAQAVAVERVVGQTVTLLNQAKDNPEDLTRWQVALAAVKQVEAVKDKLAGPKLLDLRTEIQAGLHAAERDKTLLDRLIDIRSAEADDPDGSITDGAYSYAFREAGVDLTKLQPAEAGEKIKARPSAVALAMAGALDHWAAILRNKRRDGARALSLSHAACVADPDAWRAELRMVLDVPDKAVRLTRMQGLGQQAKLDELGPISLQLLGKGLSDANDNTLAESILRRAQQKFPQDVWINYGLAHVLEKQLRGDEAIRFYTAASAIRPETAHELAHALEMRDDRDEAIAIFQSLRGLRPGNTRHLTCLGLGLRATGRKSEAEKVFEAAIIAGREEVRLKPNFAEAHHSLARALHCNYSVGSAVQGHVQIDEAIACYKKAIEIDPKFAKAHFLLGVILHDEKRNADAAIASYKKAIEIDPKFAGAHFSLGEALGGKGQWDEAIQCYKKAIEFDPKNAEVHSSLGFSLKAKGRVNGSIACFRKAVEIQPKSATVHFNLGTELANISQWDEAIACFRRVIEIDPKNSMAHYNLGNLLQGKNQLDETVACYRKAIEFDPKLAEAQCNLGNVLATQGLFAESLVAYRRGHELGTKQPSWKYPSAEWVSKAEAKAAMEAKLPAFLKGEFQPTGTKGRLSLADVCNAKKLYLPLARLYAAAFADGPKVAEDLQAGHRYNAACAAALAAASQKRDAPELDEKERIRLRKQALTWLRADLALRNQQLKSFWPASRADAQQKIRYWQHDTNLTGIRDQAALAKFSEPERKEWQAFWAEVDTALAKASTK